MMPPSTTPLKFLHPGWFSLVMGLCGLALAWHQAESVLGDSASGIALVLGGVALLGLVVLSAASVVRAQRYNEALAEDLRHPVRHAFVAAIPVSLLLLTTWATRMQLHPPIEMLVQAAWVFGAIGQLWVTIWVLQRWLLASPTVVDGKPASFWPQVTPVLLIPIVGNVVTPLAGIPLGFATWATVQFGIGLLLWPVVLTLLLVRRASQGALPDRLLPTWFITIAPPSVIGLVALQAGGPATLGWMLWGMALFFMLWIGSIAKTIVAQPFSLTFWAASFPLAAFTTLTLKLATTTESRAFQTPATLLLALTSLVICGLVLATIRGLRDGSLLAPEPVASIIPTAR
jgi:tellurite resistance protein